MNLFDLFVNVCDLRNGKAVSRMGSFKVHLSFSNGKNNCLNFLRKNLFLKPFVNIQNKKRIK